MLKKIFFFNSLSGTAIYLNSVVLFAKSGNPTSNPEYKMWQGILPLVGGPLVNLYRQAPCSGTVTGVVCFFFTFNIFAFNGSPRTLTKEGLLPPTLFCSEEDRGSER